MRRITSRRSARREPPKARPQQQRRAQDSPATYGAASSRPPPQHRRAARVPRSRRATRPQHTPPSGQPAQGQAPQSQPQTQQRPQPAGQTPQTREAQPGRTYRRPASWRRRRRSRGARSATGRRRSRAAPLATRRARAAEPQRGQSQMGARPTASPSRTYTTTDRRCHPSRFEGRCAAGPHDEWHRGLPSAQRAAARRGSQAGWPRGGRECAGSRLCAASGGDP